MGFLYQYYYHASKDYSQLAKIITLSSSTEAALSFNSSQIVGEEGEILEVCLILEEVDGEEIETPFNVTIVIDGGETYCLAFYKKILS